jgi:hypothetical protein
MHTTGFLLATIPVVALMPIRPIAPVARHPRAAYQGSVP